MSSCRTVANNSSTLHNNRKIPPSLTGFLSFSASQPLQAIDAQIELFESVKAVGA